MTSFPIQPQGLSPSQALSETVSLANAGVVFTVPLAGYGRFSASWEGDIGSAVVEAKLVAGGGSGVSFTTAQTLTSANLSIQQIDVAAVSAIKFEVTTAQADGHITIHTIAERY